MRHVPDRPGHDFRYSIDWAKARAELGFRPRHDFAAGLAATVAWYRDNPAWWKPLKRHLDEREAGEPGAELEPPDMPGR